jgi:REP element-mobilizing transposase RayT
MPQKTPKSGQLLLPMPKPRGAWGGRREGAGRPPSKGGRRSVAHRIRPFHEARQPVHVTLKLRKGIGHLRRRAFAATIGEAIRRASQDDGAAARRRRTFRVVHFSIQPDHLHFIVEATSKRALGRGMGGLASRLARRLNRRLHRRGRLFKERYHARPLATPLEVRRAISYVMTNAAKHDDPIPDPGTAPVDGIDPCSSARWFTGWLRPPPPPDKPSPTAEPRTWLLRVGWQRHGLLRRSERPAGT